jgi:hypothetical protein
MQLLGGNQARAFVLQKLLAVFVTVGVLGGTSAPNQAHAYAHDTQAWLSFQAQGSFAEPLPLGYYLEATARASSDQKAVHERYIRPAFTYRSEIGTFFLGTMVRYDSENHQVERRHWMQWSNSYALDEFRFGFRLRQEHRDLLGEPFPIYRTRAQFRVQHEALRISESVMPYISHEFLVNLNDSLPSVESGLVQTRTVIGVNTRFGDEFSFDVGYLGVVSNQTTRDDQFLHVLNMTLQFSY